eukprot:8113407-Pyramimonas_sp.AAC.1
MCIRDRCRPAGPCPAGGRRGRPHRRAAPATTVHPPPGTATASGGWRGGREGAGAAPAHPPSSATPPPSPKPATNSVSDKQACHSSCFCFTGHPIVPLV